MNSLEETVSNHQRQALARLEAWANGVRRERQFHTRCGRLEAVEEATGGRFEYAYNKSGDLAAIREANGAQTRFDYDAERRLVCVRESSGAMAHYRYGPDDRLVEIDRDGVVSRFAHDAQGRLERASCGTAGTAVFRYEEQGRVVEARTAAIRTAFRYGPSGHAEEIAQERAGVTIALHFGYDARGRLATVRFPGADEPVRFEWDARGRPAAIRMHEAWVRFEFDDPARIQRVHFSNGVLEESEAGAVDFQPVRRTMRRNAEILHERHYSYAADGRLHSDGVREFGYDAAGRLASAHETNRTWDYSCDAMEDRIGGEECHCDRTGRVRVAGDRLFRYDDADRLIEVREHGDPVAHFEYDHKGRLAAMRTADGTERFLYGPADELFAITDECGQPLRLFVQTPMGCMAEIHGAVGSGAVFFLHHDRQGTCHTATDAGGAVLARYEYDPFGLPSSAGEPVPRLNGRRWFPRIRLYCFGARWYDPALGRFLTPDTFTARPDDVRLVNPLGPASSQAAGRALLLEDWLRQPRRRNRHAFCANDPVNCVDPDGHWSFFGVVLSLLLTIWNLPNTVLGLFLEVTCLAGEVFRWLVFLISIGNVSWATPGFDVAASGRLNTFALVFRGGWLGSFSRLLGITFGNVFFVYDEWEKSPLLAEGGDVFPAAYNGRERIPRLQALYEHELRHVDQSSWLGPLYFFFPPPFGIYVWSLVVGSYSTSWFERDARDHGGI